MKSRIPSHLATFGIAICASFSSQAADIIKQNNLTSLIDGASWTGGTAPGSSDTAVFDATYTQTTSLDTGGVVNWGGLKITAGITAINIANTTATNSIALGAGGVSLGAARALTLPNTQWLSNQVWSAVALSTLTVGGTKIDATTFTLQLTSAGTTVKKGVTTLPFAGTSSLSKFVIGDDTLNSQPDAGTVTSAGDLTVSANFAIGEAAPALFIQTAGTVHSTAAASGFGSGMNLGHRGGNARYRLEGGTLRTNAALVMGVGGGNTGILEITGGTARLKGLNLTTSTSAVARIDLTGGRLNLDSAGIVATAAGTRTLNFGGGTLGATANWSSAEALIFTGTNGNTTIDTLDAVDATTPRTITLTGTTRGAGGFNKTGEGTLIMDGSFAHRGDSSVNGGTLELATEGRIRLFPLESEVSNRIVGTANVVLNGILELDLTSSAIATGNSWQLVDAQNVIYGEIFEVQSTTGIFTRTGELLHTYQDLDGNTWTFDESTGRLSVTPLPPLVWNNASTNGLWDAVSVNWKDGSGNAAFTDGDSIRFEDTANAVESISVVGTVTPATMTFANTITDFDLGGSGTIAGTSSMLVNNGGQLTLGNTGGLAFSGTLNIENASTASLATAGNHNSTNIANGSTLEFRDGASVAGPIANNGTILNTTTSNLSLSSVISGSGSIQQNGSGTLTLGAVNIHTGSVTVNSGTFRLNPAAQLYKTGAFFGTQNQNYIIINTGGVFETWNWNFGDANALARLRHNYGQILLNGGSIRFTESLSSQRAFTVGANGGTIELGAGITYTKPAGDIVSENIIRFTANSTLTISGDGDAVIGDALGIYGSTGFNIAKTGAGTLTLSGANAYTGATTVSGGSLAVNGTALADTSSLVINGGVVVPTGTETVGTLFFGAVQQEAGTWGATNSGATNIDDTRFSGTDGVIDVTSGPGGSGFASWATTNGAGAQGVNDDHDNDGVTNGIEYFLGGPNGDTTGFTTLPGVITATGIRSVTWTMAADYVGSYVTDFVVETSETLTGAWIPETLGVTVTITGDDVIYTFPAGPVRKFVRLSVTGP
jgi:autotransporter-associated beta strand protein